MGVIRTVRKRDGREVAFDKTKISEAIAKAGRATAGPDAATADELAAAVTHFIKKQYPDSAPGIEEIQDLVEKVLMETGYPETAKAYILYREDRRQVRDALQVCRTGRDAVVSDKPTDLVVDAEAAELMDSWSKGRIVEALVKEAGLSYDVSTRVANAVETKVFGSGIKRISTTLIRELVDNELFERGYSAKLTRQALIGIPKYDLSLLLNAKSDDKRELVCNNPEAVAAGIAENALKQYALTEIYPSAVVDAHLNAELHLVDLGHPACYYNGVHSIDYIKAHGLALGNLQATSAPARHPRTLTGHLGTFLASMQAYFSGPQALPFVNIFYAPMLDAFSDDQMRQEAQSLLFCGSQIAFSRGGRTLPLYFGVHSGVPDFLAGADAIGPGGKPTGRPYGDYRQTAARFGRAMLEAWQAGDAAQRPFQYPVCYLHIDSDDDGENLHYAARAPAAGDWQPELFVDQGCRFQATPSLQIELGEAGGEYSPESTALRGGAAHAVVINLAHAAFRAGKGNSRGMLQEVRSSVTRACEAHLAKSRFLATVSAEAGRPLYELGRASADGEPYLRPDQASYLVGVVGLDEAVAYLYDDRRKGDEAERLIHSLEEKLARETSRLALRIVADPAPPVEAARRLALTDRRFYPQAEAVMDDGSEGPCYSKGFSGERGGVLRGS